MAESPNLPERQWEESKLLGRSPAMLALRDQILRCARMENPVLILGEAGSGKENVARACHLFSRRVGESLVAVHCSGLSETLLESELFGHVKGAFTGASVDRKGRFEAAKGGAVFLDELGTIAQSTQIKLLRVLQEKSIERVGDHAPVPVDVRVIGATNENLDDALSAGRLRKDFYARIAHLVIAVPPLRDRGDDVLLLADKFLAQTFSDSSLKERRLSDAARRKLLSHRWPGNVRELQAVMARAVAAVDGHAVSVGEECIIFDNRLAPPANLADDLPERNWDHTDLRECVAQKTLDLLLRGEGPLDGLRRGSRSTSELVDDVIAGVVDGTARYLTTEPGRRLQRNLSLNGILDRLGLSSRSGNQSLLARRVVAELRAALSQSSRPQSQTEPRSINDDVQ